MSHAFMSVDAAADRGGFHPVATSAIARAQRDLGATFEERDGWLVPVSIPGEQERAVAQVADISHLTKLELRPAGAPIEGEGVIWYEISPRRALVMCAPSVGDSIRKLADAYRRRGLRDVTLRTYAGARHEIFNETNRDEVIADVVTWLLERFPSR